ncbi:hypothetical protein HB904_16910 [Listeria booriae]|uniref:Uncharacterized protein n=1 Tax=Listeria booriae TaxID=1552123 RepID=A0A841YQI5_9LIST|nr:hypothetical protein [Listeria booriae]MBC1402128.1 hypothetical protein [Listeria booriae]MBC1617860.1 hypothetical protein [Listeria booriae]
MNTTSETNFCDVFNSLDVVTDTVVDDLAMLHNKAFQRALEYQCKQSVEDVAGMVWSIAKRTTLCAQEQEAIIEYTRFRLQSIADLNRFKSATDIRDKAVKITKKISRQDAFKNVVKSKKWGAVK